MKVRKCNPQDPRDSAAYECLKEGAVFAHLLSRPNYKVSENLFFVEVDGESVGYVNILPELGIKRAVLDYAVDPSHWSESILTALFDRAMQRARELGMKVAHVSLPRAASTRTKSLSKLGFNNVRIYFELRLDLCERPIAPADKPKSAFRCLRPGEEAKLAEIQNRCFADTWGYNQNTAQDIAWQLEIRSNSPEDVILAMDKREVMGYCWTEAECGRDLATGKRKGRIYMLGVDPDYRNRDIGKELLKAGLWHLKSKGREIVDITVDSQNVAAVTLYRLLGFQSWGETIWYERIID